MKSQITDFAVGGKCGCLGFKGSTMVAADAFGIRPSLSSSALRARAPSPLPALHRKSRRDRAKRLCADILRSSSVNSGRRTRSSSSTFDRNRRAQRLGTAPFPEEAAQEEAQVSRPRQHDRPRFLFVSLRKSGPCPFPSHPAAARKQADRKSVV